MLKLIKLLGSPLKNPLFIVLIQYFLVEKLAKKFSNVSKRGLSFSTLGAAIISALSTFGIAILFTVLFFKLDEVSGVFSNIIIFLDKYSEQYPNPVGFGMFIIQSIVFYSIFFSNFLFNRKNLFK